MNRNVVNHNINRSNAKVNNNKQKNVINFNSIDEVLIAHQKMLNHLKDSLEKTQKLVLKLNSQINKK